MKQSYRDYLEESTNIVRSNDRKSKLILTVAVLGIWALALISFFLVHKGVDNTGYSFAVTWAVLPVTFFTASFVIGKRDWFGKLKWLAVPIFSVMYTMAGLVTSVAADNMAMKSVIWPDFAKLPIGLVISLAGVIIGVLIGRKSAKNQNEIS